MGSLLTRNITAQTKCIKSNGPLIHINVNIGLFRVSCSVVVDNLVFGKSGSLSGVPFLAHWFFVRTGVVCSPVPLHAMEMKRKSFSKVMIDAAAEGMSSRTRGVRPRPELLESEKASPSLERTSSKRKLRLAILSRHEPMMPSGFFRYKANNYESEPVALDELIDTFGDQVLTRVLKYDEQNDIKFHVAEVIDETIFDSVHIATIRFTGYPPDFDMPFDMSDGPYSGFAEAYGRFKQKEQLGLQNRSKSPDVLHDPDDDDDELNLEPMGGGDSDKGKDELVGAPQQVPEEGNDLYVDDDLPGSSAINNEEEHEEAEMVDVEPNSSERGQAKRFKANNAKKKHSNSKKRKKSKNASPKDAARDENSDKSGGSDDDNEFDDEDDVVVGLGRKDTKKKTKAQFLSLEKAKASQLSTKSSRASLLFVKVDEKDDHYRCKLCQEVKKSAVNTSNLITHLTSCHKKTWDAIEREHNAKHDVVGFVKSVLDANGKGTTKPLTQRKMDQWLGHDGGMHKLAKAKLTLLVWAIKSCLAFNIFDADEFHEYADSAEMGHDSAYLMKEKTALLHEIFVGLAEERLAQCPSISVTADMWTALTGRQYLVVTYHGINPKTFEVVHHVLDLQAVFGSSSGDQIAALVESHIARHLGRDKCIVALVLDSGSNMLRAAKLAGVEVQKCFAHGLKGVIDAVCGKKPSVKQPELHDSVVSCDLRTVKAIAKLLCENKWIRKQVLGDDDDTLQLILENTTRWEGRYVALERFLRLKAQLKKNEMLKKYYSDVARRKDLADDVLESSFFKRLESHCKLLKIFHEVSVQSQYEQQCSIAWIPLWIRRIQKACNSSASTLGEKLKLAVDKRLVRKYLSAGSLALKAALLNPCVSPKIAKHIRDPQVVSDTWDAIVKEATGGKEASEEADSQEEHRLILKATLPALQRSMNKWYEAKRSETKDREEVLEFSNEDVFSFWKDCRIAHTAAFVPVACRYLGIPATSAPAERAFSSSGLMVTKLRNRISPDLLERLIVCRDWIQQRCYSVSDTIKRIEAAFTADAGTAADQ